MNKAGRRYLIEYIERYKELTMESLKNLNNEDLMKVYLLVLECKELKMQVKELKE